MASDPHDIADPAAGDSLDGAPRHIGVILDGNRRWARRHKCSVTHAYTTGATRVAELACGCADAGVDYLTVWALSQENLQRAPEEVGSALNAICAGLGEIADQGRWHIRPVGELALLPRGCAARLDALHASTVRAGPGTLNVAVAYSGRRDIVAAALALLHSEEIRESGLDIEKISTLFSRHVANAGQPDIDLIIRTSGEIRLSGFMPWQSAYSELHFTAVDWPDFDRAELEAALREFSCRHRRLGL